MDRVRYGIRKGEEGIDSKQTQWVVIPLSLWEITVEGKDFTDYYEVFIEALQGTVPGEWDWSALNLDSESPGQLFSYGLCLTLGKTRVLGTKTIQRDI